MIRKTSLLAALSFSLGTLAWADDTTNSPGTPDAALTPNSSASLDHNVPTDTPTTVETNPPIPEPKQELLGPFQFRIYWENDSIFNPANDTDRHYTNGLAVTLAFPSDGLADVFEDCFHLPTESAAFGLFAGQQIYTPRDINADIPPPDDRPYAGYLYGGVYFQRQATHDWGDMPDAFQTLDHFQIEMGVVGPSSLAEEVQSEFHRVFGADDPEGWAFQLRDEFAFQLYYRRKWRFDLVGTHNSGQFGVQVIPQVELAAGTVHINASIGTVGRLGWNMPDDFGPGRLFDFVSATGLDLGQPPKQGPSLHVYGRLTGTAVAWNTFLNGNVYHNGPSVTPEPLVGQAQVGIVASLRLGNWTHQAGFAVTFLTHEFTTQQTNDSYALLMVNLTGRF